jgi:TolA-binding protein
MNRFPWDLRFDDPIQVPGAFYQGDGPHGPLAPPGDYQVKLTVGGKSQSAPLHLVIDPRMKGSEAQVQKNFALAVQINDRISQLHQAINQIREIKGQIKTLHQHFDANDKMKDALKAADDAEHKMSAVEEQLIQVNAKGSEATLAFPSMLNERWDGLSHLIESDHEPTQGQLDIFKLLSDQLDAQLQKWAQIKSEDVPRVNALAKQVELPVLSTSEPKKG